MVEDALKQFYGNYSAWLVVAALTVTGLSYAARGWLLGRPAAHGVAAAMFALACFYVWIALYPDRLVLEVRAGMVRMGLVILCAVQLYFNRVDVGMVLKELWHRHWNAKIGH